jgi:hypothetical protein
MTNWWGKAAGVAGGESLVARQLCRSFNKRLPEMIQRDVLPIASTPGAWKYDSIELRRAAPFPGAACLPRRISAVKQRIDLPRYKAAPLQSHGAFGNIRQSVICHLSSVMSLPLPGGSESDNRQLIRQAPSCFDSASQSRPSSCTLLPWIS